MENWTKIENGEFKAIAVHWRDVLRNMTNEFNGTDQRVIQLIREKAVWNFDQSLDGSLDMTTCNRLSVDPILLYEPNSAEKKLSCFLTNRKLVLFCDGHVEYILPLTYLNEEKLVDRSDETGAEIINSDLINLELKIPFKASIRRDKDVLLERLISIHEADDRSKRRDSNILFVRNTFPANPLKERTDLIKLNPIIMKCLKIYIYIY